jgi:DNA-binding CsgD family transcriptional regulator
MHGKSFIDLLDRVTTVKDFASGDEFLNAVRSIYGARNIAYLCINLPRPTDGIYYLHHSYSPDWARHYESNHYVNVDPVAKAGFSNILPTDWRRITDLTPLQRRFLNEAREFGIGWQGLTVSVRGLHRETAIFSINTDHSDTEWDKFKREYMRDIQVIATYFHQKIAEAQGLDFSSQIQALTPREVECLKWCAAGKTYADTATILSITERTVIFHMTLARTKLNALTNAQAVAKAVHLGIVIPG